MKSNKVDSNTVLLVIILFIFGIAVGIHLDSNVRMDNDDLSFPINRDMEVQEISDLKKVNQAMRDRILELKKEVGSFESEIANENIVLKKLRNDVTSYQLMAGHRDAEGPGIIINLEGTLGDNINIGKTIEEKKYLIKMVNELKFFGAEVIAINNQRLTSRSEVVFAGSHINVNGQPIAPPYQIQVIGDQKSFVRYIEHGTFIFEYMKSDGIRSSIQYEEKIKIPAIDKEKPIELLKPIEETT